MYIDTRELNTYYRITRNNSL